MPNNKGEDVFSDECSLLQPGGEKRRGAAKSARGAWQRRTSAVPRGDSKLGKVFRHADAKCRWVLLKA
ncbi:Protein of unknown function [Gryllus bimaculatus]|nr:Protein of unknown function [Gryllus bimaculatus]